MRPHTTLHAQPEAPPFAAQYNVAISHGQQHAAYSARSLARAAELSWDARHGSAVHRARRAREPSTAKQANTVGTALQRKRRVPARRQPTGYSRKRWASVQSHTPHTGAQACPGTTHLHWPVHRADVWAVTTPYRPPGHAKHSTRPVWLAKRPGGHASPVLLLALGPQKRPVVATHGPAQLALVWPEILLMWGGEGGGEAQSLPHNQPRPPSQTQTRTLTTPTNTTPTPTTIPHACERTGHGNTAPPAQGRNRGTATAHSPTTQHRTFACPWRLRCSACLRVAGWLRPNVGRMAHLPGFAVAKGKCART